MCSIPYIKALSQAYKTLAKQLKLGYNHKALKRYPGVAQLVARLVWDQDAGGSNPSTRTRQER